MLRGRFNWYLWRKTGIVWGDDWWCLRPLDGLCCRGKLICTRPIYTPNKLPADCRILFWNRCIMCILGWLSRQSWMALRLRPIFDRVVANFTRSHCISLYVHIVICEDFFQYDLLKQIFIAFTIFPMYKRFKMYFNISIIFHCLFLWYVKTVFLIKYISFFEWFMI